LRGQAEALLAAVEAAAPSTVPLYRGVKRQYNMEQTFVEGDVVTWESPVSLTSRERVGTRFAGRQGVVFRVGKGVHALSLRGLSRIPQEGEFLAKGSFVVTRVGNDDLGNTVVDLTQKSTLSKYSPEQPRDDHGRWTDASPHVFGSKTKGTVTVSPAPSYKLHHEAAASVFASMKPEYRVADASFSLVPTKEGTSLEDAKGLLGPGCEGLTDARDHKTELYMDEPTMQDVEHFKAVVAHEYGHSVDAEIGSYLAGVAMGDAYISRHPHFAEVVWADLEKWRVPEGYSVPGKYSYALTAPQEMFAEAYAAVVIGHSAGSDEFVKDFPRTVKAVKFLLTSYRKGAQVDA
jgi:hypothetical protein